ncbi:hypothetical protein CC86DRAFT_135322 [Ophiobolus disseminans]|uniref:Uncharacterized protein n=1 Tax=Ophiobolus disseminans TaxID=1469910 RepID=A0A6A7AEY3_9PLEO|nr:hypothetical protein CC86DRAFT_135322 [Ophiobolus disseminans]
MRVMNDIRDQPPQSPAPSLRGMERPIRSFRSFINETPPPSRSHDDKPLPPTPVYGRSIFALSSSSLVTTPDLGTSVTPWKAPAAWNDPGTPYIKLQAPSPNNTRNYAPLLPEPSPGILDRNEAEPWSFSMVSPYHSQLEPITERAHFIPALPPRSPFRLSAFNTPSAESHPGVPILSPSFYSMKTPSVVGISKSCPDPFGVHVPPVLQSDVHLRISNLSTKQKAFDSLGIELPDQSTSWESWPGGPGTPQTRDDACTTPSMQGRENQPPSRGSPVSDDGSNFADMSERLRQLSVSQDYHNILADQYHASRVNTSEQSPQNEPASDTSAFGQAVSPKPPSNNHDLIPRPLSWSKRETGSSPAGSSASVVHADAVPRTEIGPNSSYMPNHQLAQAPKRPSLDETHTRFTEKTKVSSHKRTSSYLPSLMPHLRGLGSRMKSSKVLGTDSPPIPFQPTPPSGLSPVEALQPLPHSPSGLELVQPSPTTPLTPRLQTTSFLRLSPTSSIDTSSHNTSTDILGSSPNTNDWRRSSTYIRHTYVSVASGVAVKKCIRTSVGSVPSTRTISNTSSPPTSPLAHEISFPRTPPPLPPYVPHILDVSSPQSPASYKSIERPFGSRPVSDEFPKRFQPISILEKARGVRRAWKKRQNDVKHEKLKSSIRVLGPVDPSFSDGFLVHESRTPFDGGLGESRIPGYMTTGAL